MKLLNKHSQATTPKNEVETAAQDPVILSPTSNSTIHRTSCYNEGKLEIVYDDYVFQSIVTDVIAKHNPSFNQDIETETKRRCIEERKKIEE